MASVTLALLIITWGIAFVTGAAAIVPTLRVRPRPAVVAMLAACAGLAWWRWMNHVVPLHHVMYVDEPWYLETARSLLATGHATLCRTVWEGVRCDPYPKSIGWPVVLAAAFRFVPATDVNGILVSKAFGAITVVVLGTGTAWWSGRPSRGLLAAVLLALFPTHLAWSSTAETNVPGAAVLVCALFAWLAWLRSPRAGIALCGASLLTLAASIRPEASLAFAPVAGILLLARAPARAREFAAVSLVPFMLLALATVWPMLRLNREISQGAFLRLSQAWTNGAQLARTPGVGVAFAAMVPLALLGTRAAMLAGRALEALLLAGTGFALGVLVLAFDPRHFDARMLLASFVCLVPLVATAGDLFARGSLGLLSSAVAVAAALVITRPAYRVLGRVPETQSLETALPRLARRTLPRDALVITEWPTVLRAGTDLRSVMSSQDALSRGAPALRTYAATHEVYFACDMFCEPAFGPAACRALVGSVGLRAAGSVGAGGRRYGLFRLTNDAPVPGRCPSAP